jgi:hypothetical protein
MDSLSIGRIGKFKFPSLLGERNGTMMNRKRDLKLLKDSDFIGQDFLIK